MSLKYRPLVILVALFLLIRLLILFSSPSNLIMSQELCVGTFTKMLIHDSRLPLFSCLDRYRWGGVVTGILAVPFFLLFGDSLIALRSLLLLYSLATLVVLYLFLYEFFSKRTAVIASLLFILSPPNYTRLSYVATGSYSELNFLALLTIFVFFKIFFTRSPRVPGYLFALLGFLCGFGLLFDYPFLFTLVCCLLFWFIFDARLFLKKHLYVFLILFLIGFSPWFVYNIAYRWNGLFVIHGRSIWQLFTGNSLGKSLGQFRNLLLIDIPGYFDFRDFFSVKGAYLSYLYYSVFVLSFIYVSWRHRRPLLMSLSRIVTFSHPGVSLRSLPGDVFLIVYCVLFFAVYSACGFPFFPSFPIRENIIFPYKELFPLTLFIFMIMAQFLEAVKMGARAYSSFVYYACLFVIIGAGLIGNVSLIDISGFPVSLIPRGFNYVRAGKQLNSSCTFKNNLHQCLRLIGLFDRNNRRFVYEGYDWATHEGLPDVQVYAEKVLKRIDKEYWPFACERAGEVLEKHLWSQGMITQELAAHVSAGYLPYVYRGIGREFARTAGAADIGKYLFLRNRIAEEYRRYFLEGMGIELDEALMSDTKGTIRFLNNVDRVDRESIFNGFGRGKEYTEISHVQLFLLGFGRLGVDMGKWNEIMEGIDEESRADAYQRLGIETGWRFIHGMTTYRTFLGKTQERYRPSLYRGVGIGIGWRFGYTVDGCVRIVQQFDQSFWPLLYEGIGRGAARRSGYQPDGWAQEMLKVPDKYKEDVKRGFFEASGERYEAKR